MGEGLPSFELLFDMPFQPHLLSKSVGQFFGKRCHLQFVHGFHHQVVIVEQFEFSVPPDDLHYSTHIHGEPSLHAGQQFFSFLEEIVSWYE